MPRYNFHEQLQIIKRNPKAMLPDDINKPVIDYLEKIGCLIGVEQVKRLQKNAAYGCIEVLNAKNPNAKISIQVDCGMAEGWKEFQTFSSGDWVIVVYKNIKNANLDKKRIERVEEHDRHK